MKTELKNIVNRIFFSEDIFIISYYAYDKIKKTNCILTFPKKQTSWDYSVEY